MIPLSSITAAAPVHARQRLGFFRRVGRNNRVFPRKLKFTREGKTFVWITLGIGFAAINTGNNLMYLILGMLLSLILVSGILSEQSLRKVTVVRDRSQRLMAGCEGLLRVHLSNGKKRFISYCVEVEEILDYEGIHQVPAYQLRLGPGESEDAFVRVRFLRRGVYESVGVLLATRFPFALFRKGRVLEESREILVHPVVHAVPLPEMLTRSRGLERSQPRAGQGGDVRGVRPYQSGDPFKDVHWKVTARRGRLMVREYEAPATRSVWLGLVNCLGKSLETERLDTLHRAYSTGRSVAEVDALRGFLSGMEARLQLKASASVEKGLLARFGVRRRRSLTVPERVAAVRDALDHAARARFEEAVVHVASLSAQLLARGCDVGLSTLDGSVDLGNGVGHRTTLLDHLTRMEVREDEGRGILALPERTAGVECLLVYPAGAERPLPPGFNHAIAATTPEEAHGI